MEPPKDAPAAPCPAECSSSAEDGPPLHHFDVVTRKCVFCHVSSVDHVNEWSKCKRIMSPINSDCGMVYSMNVSVARHA